MARIDCIVSGDIGPNAQTCGQQNAIVRVSSTLWYKFLVAANNGDFYYTKSINGGLSWYPAVLVKATTGIGLAVWYDGWTPGDAGAVIHLCYMESATSTVFYRSLTTAAGAPASDTLGTEIAALVGASFAASANSCLSVTKSKAGRILIGYDGDGGPETGFLKSDDYPVTAFTAKTNFNEAAAPSDYFLLFPGNYADPADIDCVYWDASASEITLKTYDDSANTWSESAALGAAMTRVATSTVCSQFSGAVRASDGHLIACAWSNVDTLNADLRIWDVNGSGSITEKTNVVLNSTDDQAACAVGIDGTDDTIYVFYLGKSDGSETAYTSLNTYYKTSTDGGTTWGSETLLSTLGARPVRGLSCAPNFTLTEFVTDWIGANPSALSITTAAVSTAGGGLLTHPGMAGGMRG